MQAAGVDRLFCPRPQLAAAAVYILTHGAEEIERDALQPGDIIVVKFGRTYSHGAIYIGDGNIIHAYVGRPVDVAELNEFIDRPKKYYRVKGIEQ